MRAALLSYVTAIQQSRGRRRNLIAWSAGAFTALAFPPLFLFPLLWLTLPALFWLLTSANTPKRSFFDGWWYGLGYLMIGLYWFCIALLVDPWKFGWLIPFTLIGLNGLLALFFSAFSLCYFPFRNLNNNLRIPIFIILWVGMELVRSHLLTGLPWNLIGYIWSFSTETIQFARPTSIYGLGALALLVFLLPGVYISENIPARSFKTALIVSLVLIALNFAGGAYRLSQHPTQFVEGIKLRLVQGNIAQAMKWTAEGQAEALRTYIRLTRSPGYENITHVIWPETAMPYMLTDMSPWSNILGQTAVPKGGMLLTGVIRQAGKNETWKIWNSLQVVDEKGQITATYDKHHLVPFGEFVPLRSVLPLQKITAGSVDFSRGPGPRTLSITNLPPFSPLICYEAIFPAEAVARTTPPAQWILNITNDGWFGNSSGPYQHFQMARMRAVEQGLPLVRVANSGITAVIDPYGRVLQTLPLGAQGILDVDLPRSSQTH